MNIDKIIENSTVLQQVKDGEEVLWINPHLKSVSHFNIEGLSTEAIDDAEKRLLRFAPYIMKVFPETIINNGLIESSLREIPFMQKKLNEELNEDIIGRLFLKMDSHLPIAGSVKARGGIYEILKHTEDLAIANGLLNKDESYEKLAEESFREFFSNYAIHVGSTGNLGLSIGIISAKVGYRVTVHMSADAKQWKKDLLRSHGVEVKEYSGDYGRAVAEGRKLSNEDSKSYFVDDENSQTLFLGYAVAARRLANQLEDQNIIIDENHPMFVYLPCGVGGAPGGIAYGLKTIFKDSVHCFFIEPTEAPCMLVGMESGLNNEISVQDIGLSGITEADGLAVGRASGFVGNVMKELLSGIFTLKDYKLYNYLKDIVSSEDIFLEPSACSSFEGPAMLLNYNEGRKYVEDMNLNDKLENSIHIAWATGGNLVPEDIREDYLKH